MQTSYEVVDNLMRKKPAERVAVQDSPWGDTLEKWVGQGMPTDAQGNAVNPAEHFGFDSVCVGGWFDWHAKAGFSEVLEETDRWRVVRNGSGAALKYWKNKSGTPEHIDFLMTDREVWERDYRPHVAGPFDRSRLKLDQNRTSMARFREQGKWCYYGHFFIWEGMRASMGDYTMYMALAGDPDWIHDYARTYTDFYKEAYRILIDEVGKPDGIWVYEDLGYKNRLFASPDMLKDLIFPYFAEAVDFFHDYDLPVTLHTCGYVEPALDMIVEAGFDGLHPMEVKAGNDPLAIAERVGDKLTLIGGLDERILESGDRDAIRKGVVEIVEGMKSRGAHYVYASDHSISTNVDYDDFRYALEVYREHMMY
ncbi:MAG: uroporphyrinogen decarboxylase family protein [Planctomycetota bacterium]